MTSARNVHLWRASTLIAGAVVATLGALVSWQTLGWDRPAWHPSDFDGVWSEIGEVSALSQSNRTLILQAEWWRLKIRIAEVETDLESLTVADGAYRPLSVLLIELQKRQRYIDGELARSIAAPSFELHAPVLE